MIKRLCVTTVPARAIGSTREHCVHNVKTDFALCSDRSAARERARFPVNGGFRRVRSAHSDPRFNERVARERCRAGLSNFSNSRDPRQAEEDQTLTDSVTRLFVLRRTRVEQKR